MIYYTLYANMSHSLFQYYKILFFCNLASNSTNKIDQLIKLIMYLYLAINQSERVLKAEEKH